MHPTLHEDPGPLTAEKPPRSVEKRSIRAQDARRSLILTEILSKPKRVLAPCPDKIKALPNCLRPSSAHSLPTPVFPNAWKLDCARRPSHECVTMRLETKYLRLRGPVTLGSRFGEWRVCWLGGWTRDRLAYLVMVARAVRE